MVAAAGSTCATVSASPSPSVSLTLSGLALVPDAELDRCALLVARGERRSTALVIAHLAEIDRRRAYLTLGYSSIFDYAVRRLLLGESCAMLRIQVARVCLRFPQILEALEEGRISLSVAALLSPVVSGENVEMLIGCCSGRTKREAQEVVVEVAPRKAFDDSVRKKPRGSEEKAQPDILALGSAPPSLPAPRPASSSPAQVSPATPDIYNFRFAAPRSFKDALVRLGEVLGIPNPLKNAAKVLEQALKVTLEVKDPARRLERREKKKPAQARHRPDDVPAPPASPTPSPTPSPSPSRHVPLALRDRVFSRAAHRCQYVAADGTRCPSRTGLQVEHREPFAVSRSHAEDNLEALCAAHNGLRAREYFGSERIQHAIATKRQATSSWTMLPTEEHRLDDV